MYICISVSFSLLISYLLISYLPFWLQLRQQQLYCMSQGPDIRHLYQNKFLAPSFPSQASPFHKFTRSTSYKFRLLSQRTNNEPSQSPLKCVKIFANSLPSKQLKLPGRTQSQRKNSRDIEGKSCLTATQSMHLPAKSNELLRQLIKVSRQEMGELETTAGGETKLLGMFQTFFQKRSKTNQKNRQKGKKHDFVPLQPPGKGRRQQESRLLDCRRKERSKRTQHSFFQKQLSPWNIQEGEFA